MYRWLFIAVNYLERDENQVKNAIINGYYFIVGIIYSAPLLMPSGHLDVTVLSLVKNLIPSIPCIA
jgi:dolichol kinase